MTRASLDIEQRDASGKSPVARRLRRTGRVPGIVYKEGGNISFSVDNLEAAAVLRKGATLIDVQLDGSEHLTVVKEFQVHPVRGNLVHIDLQAVRMDQKVRTTVGLVMEGTAPGMKEGGILTQGTNEVHIECLASQIPDQIVADISKLESGDVLILKDVPTPEGVTWLDDGGQMVAAITVPRGAKGKKQDEEGNDIEGTEGQGEEDMTAPV